MMAVNYAEKAKFQGSYFYFLGMPAVGIVAQYHNIIIKIYFHI